MYWKILITFIALAGSVFAQSMPASSSAAGKRPFTFEDMMNMKRVGAPVPSKMLYFPDEGHWVLKPQNSRLWYKTVNDWVDQWTGGR